MTDKELAKKAERYATESGYVKGKPDFWIVVQAYIAGVKDNGIVWHDLRKNPDDLPERGRQVIVIRNRIYLLAYLREDYVWTTDGHNAFECVIAWCEIPKFEEEE